MCDVKKLERVKQLIGDSTHFVSVTFEKKDGSPRTITFNKKVEAGKKGWDNISESARKGIQTRSSKHPNLIPVFDSQLRAQGTDASKCWRFVNTDTVSKVVSDGVESTFRKTK